MGISNKSQFRLFMEMLLAFYVAISVINFIGLKVLGYSVGIGQVFKTSAIFLVALVILIVIVEEFNDYIEDKYKKTEDYREKELKSINEKKDMINKINKKSEELDRKNREKEKELEEFGLSKSEIRVLSVGLMSEEDIEYIKEELGSKGG